MPLLNVDDEGDIGYTQTLKESIRTKEQIIILITKMYMENCMYLWEVLIDQQTNSNGHFKNCQVRFKGGMT